MLASPFLELHSTIPPEPVPAWTSVYTGQNPANHGMLAQMDCLERLLPDPQPFDAELFWERVARAGKRVCVLNPLLARHSDDVPDLTIAQSAPPGGMADEQDDFTFPALLDEPLIPPSSQLSAFCDLLQERTEQQVHVALEMFARGPWDLFFVQLDALDHVQHFLWRYSDPGDPMYPGKNEHASRILDFYQLFDQIVGRFQAVLPGDSMLAIVSSHGHERRCTYRVHINEWLRHAQYVVSQGQSKTPEGRTGGLLNRLRQFPWRGSTRHVSHTIDQEQSLACLVELASTTSTYGGIRLNRKQIAREQRDYEQVREAILVGLAQLTFKDSPVVNWIKKREDCYQGELLDRYPDLLFELHRDFGVGRGIQVPLIMPDSTHRLVSGSHSARGVFLLENWPEEVDVYEDFQNPSVMDVAPTCLQLLQIACPELDGQPLVRPRVLSQLL
jgi:predicted AlkP superfamily phosphohydrolase/phosphomutase